MVVSKAIPPKATDKGMTPGEVTTMSSEKLEKEIAKVQKDESLTSEQKERQIAVLRLQAECDEDNETRSGVGLRRFAGQTRGKGAQVISWEAFDTNNPDTLPKSLKQFSEVAKVTNESDLLAMAIIGYNDTAYTNASDVVAEHMEPNWSDDLKALFRTNVKNYSKMLGISIEDAVAVIKPGVMKAQAAKG